MVNHRLYKIGRLYTLATSEPERLKVAALNLFHPTASPLFPKNWFFHIATQFRWGEGWGEGRKEDQDLWPKR